MKIVVVADSHAPRRWKGVPPALAAELVDAHLVLHAGDVCVPGVLDELAAYAPVRAVMGNNDGEGVRAWGATDDLQLGFDGVRVAMIHIAGPKDGRGGRMRRRFPDADLVVFGHSHMPLDEVQDGVHLLNPGSVADPRREPSPSFAVVTIADGRWQSPHRPSCGLIARQAGGCRRGGQWWWPWPAGALAMASMIETPASSSMGITISFSLAWWASNTVYSDRA